MLGDEFGTASNIKNRVNRQSVLGAITSAQQRLKLYNKVPPNGLVLYTGTIVTDDGKEKKVTLLYYWTCVTALDPRISYSLRKAAF